MARKVSSAEKQESWLAGAQQRLEGVLYRVEWNLRELDSYVKRVIQRGENVERQHIERIINDQETMIVKRKSDKISSHEREGRRKTRRRRPQARLKKPTHRGARANTGTRGRGRQDTGERSA